MDIKAGSPCGFPSRSAGTGSSLLAIGCTPPVSPLFFFLEYGETEASVSVPSPKELSFFAFEIKGGSVVKRRRFLREAARGILACGACAGPAFAQKSGDAPARSSANSTEESASVGSSEAIERVLAPILKEHHLPGLVGGLIQGDRLEAIGAVGIRKVGSLPCSG